MTFLQLAFMLITTELNAAKVGGAAPEILANLQASLDALLRVHGTDVTFDQLEGLRVTAKW